MNLKSVAMATGLVLTFAAGAWLSTVMLGTPQRASRVAVQEHAPNSVKPVPADPAPERPPETPVSSSILPPLPPLPPAPVETPTAQTPVAEASPAEPPPAEQSVQPPEPPPPPPSVTYEAPVLAPEQPTDPVAEAVPEVPPPAPAPTPEPPAEAPSEPGIDPGIAALSDLVARPPSAAPPAVQHPHPAASPAPAPPLPPPSPARSPVPQDGGRYFTIQVGSFQDPANAASLVRSLESKGWEAFVVDWTNSTGHVWKVVRVGRYQTEAQATSASAELLSAANLRGNVIRAR